MVRLSLQCFFFPFPISILLTFYLATKMLSTLKEVLTLLSDDKTERTGQLSVLLDFLEKVKSYFLQSTHSFSEHYHWFSASPVVLFAGLSSWCLF